LINQAAQRAGAPEAALSAIDELGLLGVSASRQACRAYCRAVEQVMMEWADKGNVVIVGRAGQVILRAQPGVLHVRVVAPLDIRAERVATAHGISLESARAQVEASDKFRRHYLKRFYRVSWDDPELYDLVVNTGRVTPATAAEMIVQMISHERAAEPVALHGEPAR
jgi:cytidylate kinase